MGREGEIGEEKRRLKCRVGTPKNCCTGTDVKPADCRHSSVIRTGDGIFGRSFAIGRLASAIDLQSLSLSLILPSSYYPSFSSSATTALPTTPSPLMKSMAGRGNRFGACGREPQNVRGCPTCVLALSDYFHLACYCLPEVVYSYLYGTPWVFFRC